MKNTWTVSGCIKLLTSTFPYLHESIVHISPFFYKIFVALVVFSGEWSDRKVRDGDDMQQKSMGPDSTP